MPRRLALRSRSRRRPRARARRLLPELRVARRWDRQRGDDVDDAARGDRARCFAGPATTSSIRRSWTTSAAASRSTARDYAATADAKAAELEAALRDGERRRPAADRVRHQPVRLPDEAGAAGPAAGVRPHRVPARPRAAAADDPAGGRAGGRASGLQRSQDGPGVESSRPSPRRCSAAGDRAGDDVHLLRLGRRPRLHLPGTERARAARTCTASLPAGCSAGYSTSRTCEIGLSEHAGVPYRSIVYLVDACSAG